MENDYSSPQEIIDTMTLESMKEKLKELGIKFHPAEKEKKLSERLFLVFKGEYNNPKVNIKKLIKNSEHQKLDDAIDNAVNDIEKEVIPSDPIMKEDRSDAQRVEDAAAKIRQEAMNVNKGKRLKSKTYISKKFNHWLSTRGKDKIGREIRYVKGQKTLFPEQQIGVRKFKVDNLRFRGVENYVYEMGEFTGLSILLVTDPLLMEYIESHESFGRQIVEYDEEELSRVLLIKDRMETKLKFWAYEATTDDLVAVLTYIEGKMGKKSYDKLSSTIDKNKLISSAIRYIEHDPDAFLNVMESQTAKMYHLVHKAKDIGIISVSRNGRDIKMTENNSIICHSSVSSDWEYDLITHLLSPNGGALLSRFQRDLNYYVV